MAVWQLGFYIIHRELIYNDLADDSIIAWGNNTFTGELPDISFLPRKPSWSNDIIQYGDLDSDCMEFLLNDKKQIEEIECRLDVRCITKEKLEIVLYYINQIEADIYIDGKIISPQQIEKIISLIRDSSAMKFCINPQAFFKESDFWKVGD